MSRPLPHSRPLLLAVAACAVLAIVPSRYTRTLTAYAAEPARIALAPPSRIFTLVADFLRPPRGPGLADDPAVREIEQARDEYARRWRRAEQRISELQALVNELQRGRADFSEVPFSPLAVPVIARSTDPTSAVVTVRGGRDRDVTPNAVASAAGVHLVGRVAAVHARTSDIVPITHRATNWMRVAIDPAIDPSSDEPGAIDPDARIAHAQIQPVGEGLLRGEVDADAPDVAVGQTVRLSDDSWPRSAQMLIVGRIVEIAPKDTQPLRTVITVRPVIDPSRVSQVFLWIPDDALSSTPTPLPPRGWGQREGFSNPLPLVGGGRGRASFLDRSRSGEGLHNPLPPRGWAQGEGFSNPLPLVGRGRGRASSFESVEASS